MCTSQSINSCSLYTGDLLSLFWLLILLFSIWLIYIFYNKHILIRKTVTKTFQFSLVWIMTIYQMQCLGRITKQQSSTLQNDSESISSLQSSLFMSGSSEANLKGSLLNPAAYLVTVIYPKTFFPLTRICLGWAN